jgi:hypothetical protein
MGFSQKITESNSVHAIAGAASGCITRFLCQPLDVIKIRFQVNYMRKYVLKYIFFSIKQIIIFVIASS